MPSTKRIADLVLAQVAAGEVLVVGPELLAEFRDGGARQEQPPALVPEGVLDVAHRQAAGQELDRQPFQCLGPALQVAADLRAERRLAPRDLRRSEVDQPLRRLQPAWAHAVAIAPAFLGATFVVVPAERIPALRLESLLDDQPRRQLHQFGPSVWRAQSARDQIRQ